MSERKVLTKYYPPDFDPSAITRTRKVPGAKAKLLTVRLMAPFSMRCTSCGEYIYKGRKFNARKETTEEKYLSITIYRFYIRCTRCSGEITFKTDPKNMDYVCERGAKRNFEPWRDSGADNQNETEQEVLDRLEREENEEREQLERDKMAELEEKMLDSKREMAVADALDEIRTRNARIERGEARGEEVALAHVIDEADEARLQAEKEDEEAARRAFMTSTGEKVKRLVEDDEADHADDKSKNATPVVPSFTRTKKPKKPFSAGLGIKKKTSLV
ncbi:Pre-mRNA-splicing factor cwf16 [Talaromyces islandicus]|uniref:Splicing factor YJU2 n=1 Tax=Talaromyces islandicus TaxID=28573 RepID=A0A0U1LVW9_TALIS|nr:Pre-mRNA-splicing factor cwf16 [Talaromyces islandicus]